MKKKIVFAFIIMVSVVSIYSSTHILYTTDGTKYEGNLVAFKYGLLHFNVYKFNKYRALRKFPLSKVWKIEFNAPKDVGIAYSFETESVYARLRRGKRLAKINLKGNTKWLNTGINIKANQSILFSVSGSIHINKRKQVFQDGELEVRWNKHKTLPVQSTGAVIAKIGENGKPFYVGSNKTPIRCNSKGKLFIGINDFNFNDNSGNFIVKIFY